MKRLIATTFVIILSISFFYVPYIKAYAATPLNFLAMSESGGVTFSDIEDQTRYTFAVPYVVSRGFMKGFNDGSFRLSERVTRADVIYAATKAAGLTAQEPEIQHYRDVRKSNPSFEAINIAHEHKILNHFNLKNTLRPRAKVTISDALHMLFGAYEKSPVDEVINRGISEHVLLQKADGSLYLDLEAPLTRGEFAVLLYRFLETRNANTFFGMASWYGDGLSKVKVEGVRQKNLAENFMTAAHREVPIGTILKVTNEMNGKSTEVVVNDRGPYITGRIIDLSRSGFSAIENPGTGTAVVKVEVVD